MDTHQESQEQVSQYPDPEQSGLSFPWLDQYQPMAAEHLATRLQPIVHEDLVSEDDESAENSGYRLGRRRRSSIMLAAEETFQPSIVLEGSEEDPDFVDLDVEAE